MKATVYAFRERMFGRMPVWVAVADDGAVVAVHVSSSDAWGEHDVGPTGLHRHEYVTRYGPNYLQRVEYVVTTHDRLPLDIRERYLRERQLWEHDDDGDLYVPVV